MIESPIRAVECHALRIPRDLTSDTGTAGSPARLQDPNGGPYSIAESYKTVYSSFIETALVKITTEDGFVGWGEAQAPVVPEAAQSIITHLLAPLLIGESALAPARLHLRMYDAMRVRGHFTGFYADAMAAVDCALWDIAGQQCGLPVHRMLGGPIRDRLPAYISGLAGASPQARVSDAERYFQSGFRVFKLFLSEREEDCVATIRQLHERFGKAITILVDALWRLDEKRALRFAEALSDYDVGWLEAPLPPENLEGHRRLAAQSPIPIAIGESYRSSYEALSLLQASALHVLQPDVGRCGITEGVRIASLAHAFHVPVALHLSIALGPQTAAALQVAAALPNLLYVECNPRVLAIAQRFSDIPGCIFADGYFSLPQSPGLGIEMKDGALMELLKLHTQ